jgi:HlyD family secretion protein
MKQEINSLPGEEILRDSIESFFTDIGKPTRLLYVFLVLTITAAISTTFFVNVPVNVYSRGIIKPGIEPILVKSPLTALVIKINKAEGDEVKNEEPIVFLDTRNLEIKLCGITERISTIEQYIKDLEGLYDPGYIPVSEKYLTLKAAFLQKLEAYENEEQYLDNTHIRISVLHRYKLISEKEFEDSRHQLEKLRYDKQVYQKQHYSERAYDLSECQRELESLISSAKENSLIIEKGKIKSSVKGRIHNLQGFQPGDNIFEGQDICQIIPDTNLIGEILLQAKDYRWISEGMKVRILMDSYNYQYWGTIGGEISKMPADISNFNGELYYRIRCKLETPQENGRIELTELRSGMPFTAQISLGNVKLIHLLSQKFNKLFGPAYP